MPFKSEKQRKWMHANQPEMAKKWEKEKDMNESIEDFIYQVKKFDKIDPKKKPKLFTTAVINKMKEKRNKSKNNSNKKKLQTQIDTLEKNLKRNKFIGEGNIGITTKKGKSIELTHKTSGKEIVVQNTPSVLKKYAKMGYLISMPEEKLEEKAKRDYKDEYKKFQSSDKSKKYRAELNKYNRKKGTYGNGDGKDASHKGGKIAGFEKESVNRGRREKSRLKQEGDMLDREREKQTSEKERLRDKHMKDLDRTREKEKRAKKQFESKLRKIIKNIIIEEGFAGSLKKEDRKGFDNMRRKQSEVLGYTLTGQDDIKVEIDDATIHEFKELKEGSEKYDNIKKAATNTMALLVKKLGLKTVKKHLIGKSGLSFFIDDPKEADKLKKFLSTKLKRVRKIDLDKDKGDETNFVIAADLFEGKIKESGIMYHAGVKKYGKEGMKKIQQAAGKRKSHASIGKIKDKYEKGKKEGKIREKKETAIDVAKRIVKNHQYEQGVDAQTANLIMKIYHAYDKNPALQKKFEKMPLKKLAHGVWRFVK